MLNSTKLQKISERCDKFSAFGFYALIYFIPISNGLIEWSFAFIFLPFVYKRTALFIYQLNRISQKSIKEISLCFAKSYKPVKNCLNKPIGIYVLVIFVSAMFSSYRGIAFKNFVFSLLECVYIYFVFVEVMVRGNRIKKFLSVLLVSLALISVNGLFQSFFGEGFIHHHLTRDQRITSSFKHPNDFGAYLVMLLPLVLSLTPLFKGAVLMNKEDKRFFVSTFFRYIMFGLFVIALSCLGFTFSRGAWLAFLASLVFLGLVKRKKLLIITLVGGIFLFTFYPLMVSERHVSFISDQTGKSSQENKQMDSMSFVKFKKSIDQFGGMGRKTYWNQAFNVIKQNPLFGVGLDAYSVAGPKYNKNWNDYYAHNCYLQMAAEIGIIGLLVFFWIIIKLYAYTLGNLKGMNDEFSSLLTSGIFAGIFGFLVHSFFDTNLNSVSLVTLFWLCLGLLVGVQLKYEQKDLT